jgi:uncharacterized protein (TIGR02217 family)
VFHEIQFPTGISYGSSFGPATNTSIIRTDSGSEQRVSRWSGVLRRGNLGYGVKSLDDLYAVQKFFIARQGPAFGFRLKDWSDYTTAANGTSSPSTTDQNIGTGNGTTAVSFQLRKAYSDAAATVWRNITKPVVGTVVCALNGSPTTAFTVNTTTGVVTFNTAPLAGVSVTAGCQFDVPVRFGKELDSGLRVSIDSFQAGSIPDIPVEEIADNLALGELFPYGGSSEIVLAYDQSITVADGRFLVISPTAGGKSIILPNPVNMPTGGPYWFISQNGANTFNVKNHLGTTLVTVAVGKSTIICLTQDGGGTKYWYAL